MAAVKDTWAAHERVCCWSTSGKARALHAHQSSVQGRKGLGRAEWAREQTWVKRGRSGSEEAVGRGGVDLVVMAHT